MYSRVYVHKLSINVQTLCSLGKVYTTFRSQITNRKTLKEDAAQKGNFLNLNFRAFKFFCFIKMLTLVTQFAG